MRVHFHIYEIRRGNPFRNKVLVCFHHRLVEIWTSEISSVYKEELVAETLFGKVRAAGEAINMSHRSAGVYINYFICHVCAQQVLNPEFQRFGWLEHIDFLVVVGERKTCFRPCESDAGEFRHYVPEFNIV